jgi:signal transduction histidine kinase
MDGNIPSMKVKVLVFLFLLILTNWGWANNIDSLEAQLGNTDDLQRIDILTQLSKAYWSVAPGKGMFYANEAIKLTDKYNDQSKKAKALLYGGVNAWFMGSYDDAINYYQRSLTIAVEINDERLCAYNLNNLGMVNTQLKNYEKAIENYSASSLIMEKIGDKIEYAKIENNIAELNLLLGNIDKALAKYLSVLAIIEKSDEQIFLIWLYNDVGSVYKTKGDQGLALQYFNKALDLSVLVDSKLGRAKTLNHIGEVYLQLKDYEKAKENFFGSLNFAKATDAKENINESYKSISEYFAAVGNYKESLNYYKLHKQLSDSIINENKIQTIVEMQTRYELDSKEKENSLLRKNIEINELTIKKNKAQTIFFIVLLLLTVSVIILTYKRLLIKKRKNDELNDKNILINKQKDQLSKTLNELQELNEVLNRQKDEIQSSKKDLESINKSLAEINATKDKFFSIIAHDLINPFNSILGFSELLENEFDKYENAEKKQMVSYIHQGIGNAYSLLDNLLQWASTQRGTIHFEPSKIDLFLLAQTTCNLLNQSAIKKSITLQNEVDEGFCIQADYNMISAIVRNLVSNAIKFTPKGGEVKLGAKMNDENRFIEIIVKDNGRGIPADVQSKLFNIEGNTSTRGTENEGGTGLGLILCKEFVEKHNGTIWVESEIGKGSTFYFTIPNCS